jgi:hypothetical protein
MLLSTKTQLQKDTALLDKLILDGLEATHHAVTVRYECYRRLWELPPDRVLALLNSNIDRSLAVLQANTAQGIADNASLDLQPMPELPNRAPITMPPGYAFADGEFTFTPEALSE